MKNSKNSVNDFGFYTNYFVSLDLLRFICATSIVFWHYQGFYSGNQNSLVSFTAEDQPFYSYFKLFYNQTFQAVPIFWIISGIVLSHVYLNYKSTIDIKSFITNRFSRLYPLHIITLILLFLTQSVSSLLLSEYQIYPCKIHSLIANLFFLSDGNTCNAPVWSVSVEIFIYVIFILLVTRMHRHLKVFSVGIALASYTIYELTFWSQTHLSFSINSFGFIKWGEIFNCSFYFFAGVFLYLANISMNKLSLILLFLANVIIYYVFDMHWPPPAVNCFKFFNY